MNEDPLEATLARLRPKTPSLMARERVRDAIERSESSGRKHLMPGIAAVILLALTLSIAIKRQTGSPSQTAKSLIAHRTGVAVPLPTVISYRNAATLGADHLDELLMKQSSRLFPPTRDVMFDQRLD
jgi:hypothetical protein